jgi:protease prsW family protein
MTHQGPEPAETVALQRMAESGGETPDAAEAVSIRTADEAARRQAAEPSSQQAAKATCLQPPRTRGIALRYQLLAVSLAVAGGFLGVGGALFEELRAGGLGFIAAAPIEEALKPAGIYILLVRWPFILRDRRYTIALCALSGLTFGIIEACVYVFIYFAEGSGTFVLYRFTLPLLMHTLGSGIVGSGLDHRLIDWANGTAAFPRRTRNAFIAAMALHGAFNLTAVVLTVTGVVRVR